jgi:hypothetical protein
MPRVVDLTWPFFQPTRPKLFSRITNNDQIDDLECYLLRDRRDGYPKMDYIVSSTNIGLTSYGFFVERFLPGYFKSPLNTEWKSPDKFYNWFDNKKLFNLMGYITIKKSMINNPSIDPEKSATIYYLPGFGDVVNKSSDVTQFLSNAIKSAIQVNPSLKNELPADLIQTMVIQDSNRGGGKRPTTRRKKRFLRRINHTIRRNRN